MSSIVLVDTSILLNVLNVEGRNQHRAQVLGEMEVLIDGGDHLFIPMAAIFEAGNHIAHVADGQVRRSTAEQFVQAIKSAFNDEAPWKPINLPSTLEVIGWLGDFPDSAMVGIGMGDHSIKKEWSIQCRKFPMSRVRVWSLDGHLSGLDRRIN